MERALSETLGRLELGEPVSRGTLHLLPLFGGAVGEEGLALLEEALREGGISGYALVGEGGVLHAAAFADQAS